VPYLQQSLSTACSAITALRMKATEKAPEIDSDFHPDALVILDTPGEEA
jgi:hypothetical protein